jgi:polyisoprenoid-binding protein YceI
MKTFLTVGIFSISLFMSACEDPAANKTKAITSNASTPAANTAAANTATASAKGEQLAIDPENSKVSFVGSKVTGSHDGGFTKFNGSINLVNGKVEDSSVKVDIETASIFANVDQLTQHLRSADFFDVEKYPKATFTSTKLAPNAEKGADNYTVTGDLELHGQKKTITFPATIKVAADTVEVNAEFSINRKDFGILYAGKADDLIRDDVVIKLDLKTPRKK